MSRIERGLKIILIAAILLVPAVARSADRSFDRIVHRMETHYGKSPGLNSGFMNFLASCFAPSGVGHLKMAVFDELDTSKGPLSAEFDAFLKEAIGPEYKPLVQIRSHKDGERVHVFLRDAGKHIELLMLSAESTEAVVLKMRLDPEALEKWLQAPVEMTKNQEHGQSKESPMTDEQPEITLK